MGPSVNNRHGGAPSVAVVVSTRDRADQLAELVEGLRAQTLPRPEFEVVIVDDASSDGTADLLATEVERGELALRVLRRRSPGGAAVGREQGWRAAEAAVIAFTDDDCVPQPAWLDAGLRACRANPGAIVQGRTAPRPDQLDRLGPFSRTIDVPRANPAFQTTNIFYPRSVLERVGGFDTETFAGAVGGEDTDLGWRAVRAGVRTAFTGDAVVHHAVNTLGAAGLLRVASRWTAVVPYARYPELRRADFVVGRFRKRTHLLLAIALLGIAPGRGRLPRLALTLPYLRSLRGRARADGASVLIAPYYLCYDLAEVWATVRGGVRCRRLML